MVKTTLQGVVKVKKGEKVEGRDWNITLRTSQDCSLANMSICLKI